MKIDLLRANVVGVAHTLQDLLVASNLEPGKVDAIEARLDGPGMWINLEMVQKYLYRIKARFPIIITVRDPREGGMSPNLSLEDRVNIYLKFLDIAAAIDVEIVNCRELSGKLITTARKKEVITIGSAHGFKQPLSRTEIKRCVQIAENSWCTVLKLAFKFRNELDFWTTTDNLRQITFPNSNGIWRVGELATNLSIMGMGKELGPASRYLFAKLGSVLNYGYIEDPQAPGQWPAIKLRELLDTV